MTYSNHAAASRQPRRINPSRLSPFAVMGLDPAVKSPRIKLGAVTQPHIPTSNTTHITFHVTLRHTNATFKVEQLVDGTDLGTCTTDANGTDPNCVTQAAPDQEVFLRLDPSQFNFDSNIALRARATAKNYERGYTVNPQPNGYLLTPSGRAELENLMQKLLSLIPIVLAFFGIRVARKRGWFGAAGSDGREPGRTPPSDAS